MGQNLQYPMDLTEENSYDRYPGHIRFQVIRNVAANEGAGFLGFDVLQDTIYTLDEGDPIRMYLPSGLQISDGVAYNNMALGILGTATETFNKSLSQFEMPSFRGGDPGTITQYLNLMSASAAAELLGGALSRIGGGSTIAGIGIGSMVDDSKIAAGVSLSRGRSINPNIKAVLERVNIRSFSFLFQMTPRSQEEADIITRIVKVFRTELYPQIQEGPGGYPLLYRYPNKFDIKIFPAGEANTKANRVIKFKPCFLSNVNVTHNSTSTTYFADGTPVETTLTLTFMEDSTLSKEDIAIESEDPEVRNTAGGAGQNRPTFSGESF